MRGFVVAAVLAGGIALTSAAPALADDKVPPGTGCCFSFDKSPVTIVFCQVPNSCVIGGKP